MKRKEALINEEAIHKLRAEGKKITEIEKLLNLSPQQVRYYLYKKGYKAVKRKNNPVPTIPKDLSDRITVLTNFGYTPCEISEDLSIPKGKVIRYIAHLFHTNQISKRV